MIYYLPERIYEILKDNNEVTNKLKNLEYKFSEFDNFKDYISGYSRLENGDPEMKALHNEIDNLIKNLLYDKPILLKEFSINNGDLSVDDMINMFNFFDEKQGIDLENKFYLLSNIINKSEDHNISERYIETYVSLYETTLDNVKKDLSKYIHLKYMYSKIYIISKYWIDFEDTGENTWISRYLDTVYAECIKAYNITNDKDITLNYYLEALTTGIKRLNYNREYNKLYDTIWLNEVMIHIELGLLSNNDDEINFQYEEFNSGYLLLLDEMATIFCLHSYKIPFLFILGYIVKYINNSFENKKTLLRGLSYYDKVNHNMYALIVSKYLKLTEFINDPKYKIEGLDNKDREYFLSDELCNLSAASPNKLQEERTKDSMNLSLQAMIDKCKEFYEK